MDGRTEEGTDVGEQTKGLRQGQTERRTRTEGQTDGRTARFEYGSLGFIE